VAKSEATHQGIGTQPREARPLSERLGPTLRWYVRHFRKEWQIYVLLAPMIIWFLVFLYKTD